MTCLDWFAVACGVVLLGCICADAATSFTLVRFRFYLLTMAGLGLMALL